MGCTHWGQSCSHHFLYPNCHHVQRPHGTTMQLAEWGMREKVILMSYRLRHIDSKIATCICNGELWCYIRYSLFTQWGCDKMTNSLLMMVSNLFWKLLNSEGLFPGIHDSIRDKPAFVQIMVWQQAIFWTNNGLVDWRLYASLDGWVKVYHSPV